MSSVTPPATSPPEQEDDDFPIVAIVCVAIGVYLIIIMIVLIVRFCLQRRGVELVCCADINCCAECGLRCDGCLQQLGETCNCTVPSCTACLDSMCPTKEQCAQRCGMTDNCSSCGCPDNSCCDFGDLSCVCHCGDFTQCCADCQGPSAPSCECCGNCHCTIRLPECQDITCLCFECGREENG